MSPRMIIPTLIGRIGSLALICGLGLSAVGSSLQLVSTIGPQFNPASGGGGDSYFPTISRDGRYVLFASTANNLVTVQSNRAMTALFPAPINVFLRDRIAGSTTLVSVNLNGTGGGDSDSLPMGVSTNGRYALFESSAGNLVTNESNDAGAVFVRDLLSGTTRLVSVSTNGEFANSACYGSAMTPDGRYVAFASAADNLVAGDTNGIPDVFVRDLESNTTTLVSIGAQPRAGFYPSASSDFPTLTPDGRYVAFYSTASNLVSGVQALSDVYLRDRILGTTTRVSSDALAALQTLFAVTNAVSFNYALSDDGRFVAFEATASPQSSPGIILRYDSQTEHTDLIETNANVSTSSSYPSVQNLAMTPDGRFVAYVANAIDTSGVTTAIRVWDAQRDTNILVSADIAGSITDGSLSDSPVIDDSGRFVGFLSSATALVTNEVPGDFHLYLRNLETGTTTLIDADTNGVGSPIDPLSTLVMSADARFVAFDCQDSSLVPWDRNHSYDVFLRDVTNSTIVLISTHDPALPSFTPDGVSEISSFSVSSDARFVAFWSEADDLVSNDTNGLRDIFFHDRLTGTNVLVSVGTNGSGADGISTEPAISGDGRYVAFTSLADNLVSGDNNRLQDVYVRDMQSGAMTLVSVNSTANGPGNGDSYSPQLGGNGRLVLFRSKAGNLSAGMTAGTENLFCRDLQLNTTYALTTNGLGAASMTANAELVAYSTSSTKTVSSPDRLFIWDSQLNSIVYSLTGIGFTALAISSNGERIAYAENINGIKQLSAADRVLNTNWTIAPYRGGSTAWLRFSADGRYLTYVGVVGLLPYNQVYLYDFDSRSNLLVSQRYDGSAAGNDHSDSPDLSSDGRFVAYRSAASNLVANDSNDAPDIFLYDRVTGATTLISANRFGGGSADNRSLTPILSADGLTLVFESWASDLLPNDFNNNLDLFSYALENGGGEPALKVAVTLDPNPGSGCALSWPAASGKSYRVEFKNSLSDPVWQPLTGQISVVGNQANFKDSASPGTRFYRIVAY